MVSKLNENYHLTSVEDILDGYVGNVDDAQIDSDIKMWRKFSNLLGTGKWYTHVSVLVDGDGEYDPSYYNATNIQSKNGWRLYELDGIKVISEYRNGINFLYFNNDEDAEKYVAIVDKINNPDEVTEDLQLTEDVDSTEMIPYEIYFDLADDYDIDRDMDMSDLEEIAPEDVEETKSDAIQKFFDCVQTMLVDNGVEVKRMCGIDDFTIQLDDIDTLSPAATATFYASNKCDLGQLTNFIQVYSSECEGASTSDIEWTYYTGRTEHSPYYPDSGIPEIDSSEVRFTYGVSLYKLEVSEV